MFVAYLRVSSADQNLARQEELINEWKQRNNILDDDLLIYEEKVSGKNIEDRMQLQEVFRFIRKKDTVVVTSLDRLSRNSRDIKRILQTIREKGANVEILDLPAFTGITEPALKDLLTNLVIEVFSYVAESERKKIKERQRQGIELAKQRGVYKGRRVKYSSEATGADKLVYDRVIEMLNQQRSIKDISVEVGIPRKTVYAIRDRQKVND